MEDSTQIVAERSFELRQQDGTIARVWLAVEKPRLLSGRELQRRWECNVHDERPGRKSIIPVPGEDSFQALIVALYVMASAMDTYERIYGDQITWQGRKRLRLRGYELPEDLDSAGEGEDDEDEEDDEIEETEEAPGS